MVEASRPTPFIEPVAIGVPIADFLDGFKGEGCDDKPETLRFELHDVESDGQQIVRYLARLAKIYASNACVIHFAQCLAGSLAQNDDKRSAFERIAGFVLYQVVYQADPRGVEYVRSPVQMLRRWRDNSGTAYGDCDDHVLLLNSLLGALGIATRAVAVMIPASESRPASGKFDHVIAQVNLGAGWFDFDPCNKADPLFKFPGERITMNV